MKVQQKPFLDRLVDIGFEYAAQSINKQDAILQMREELQAHDARISKEYLKKLKIIFDEKLEWNDEYDYWYLTESRILEIIAQLEKETEG